ncbi:MAG: hypothetical protein QOH97_2490 [Actinoplanes sp.]|nr:hypothetical protein [Actinoplanes sp.]
MNDSKDPREHTPYEQGVMRENFEDTIESALQLGDRDDKLEAIGKVLMRILVLLEAQVGANTSLGPTNNEIWPSPYLALHGQATMGKRHEPHRDLRSDKTLAGAVRSAYGGAP